MLSTASIIEAIPAASMAIRRCWPGIAHIQVTHVGLPPECRLVYCLAVGLRADTIRDTANHVPWLKTRPWTCSRA